jgi:serine/threonine protein kinase
MFGEPVDRRADLYSLSVVGFHALTGRTPFSEGSIEAVLARKATGELPDVHRFREDVSDAILEVLHRGAARDPDDRFPSASAYLEALRAARRADSRGPRQWLRQLFGTR